MPMMMMKNGSKLTPFMENGNTPLYEKEHDRGFFSEEWLIP